MKIIGLALDWSDKTIYLENWAPWALGDYSRVWHFNGPITDQLTEKIAEKSTDTENSR